MRSPAVARELEMKWIEAEWPTTWDQKYGARALPLSQLNVLANEKNKPSLIYVFRHQDTEERDALEQKLFGSEDVILGSRFFRCYRISDASLPDEKIKEKYLLKRGPTLIILDARGNEIARNKKRVSSSWVYGKMKRQFKSDFGDTIAKHIKKLSNWLDDLEKAEDKVADAGRLVDAAKQAMEKRETAKKQQRLEKAENNHKKFEDAFNKLIELGQKLSAPKLKELATAKK